MSSGFEVLRAQGLGFCMVLLQDFGSDIHFVPSQHLTHVALF